MTRTDPGEDMLDIRDLIERFEEIEDTTDEDATEERDALKAILEECEGNGGDEKWRGDWYPLQLIKESYFEDYARQLAEDIGAIKDDVGWPMMHIDWTAAAEALLIDYTSVEFGGFTYYTR